MKCRDLLLLCQRRADSLEIRTALFQTLLNIIQCHTHIFYIRLYPRTALTVMSRFCRLDIRNSSRNLLKLFFYLMNLVHLILKGICFFRKLRKLLLLHGIDLLELTDFTLVTCLGKSTVGSEACSTYEKQRTCCQRCKSVLEQTARYSYTVYRFPLMGNNLDRIFPAILRFNLPCQEKSSKLTLTTGNTHGISSILYSKAHNGAELIISYCMLLVTLLYSRILHPKVLYFRFIG